MATDFLVIGEHREDAGFLLLLADDGRFYALHDDAPEEAPIPVEPDDAWAIAAPSDDAAFLL